MNHAGFALQGHATYGDNTYIVGQSGCVLHGTAKTDHYECLGMNGNENLNAILPLNQNEVILSSDRGLRFLNLKDLKRKEKHK